MNELTSVQKDINIEYLSKWLGIQTESGKTALIKKTSEWISDYTILCARSKKLLYTQQAIQQNPSVAQEINDIYKELSIIEPTIRSLSNNVSTLENETYGELFFMKQYTQSLNFIPYLLFFWMIFRLYILPGMSIFFPIIILIFPYIFLKFIFKVQVPITIPKYFTILQGILSGNINVLFRCGEISDCSTSSPPWSALLRCIWIIIPIVQSIIQPYWTFKHLKSVNSIINEHVVILERFNSLYNKLSRCLQKIGISGFRNPIPTYTTGRENMANILIHPIYFKYALQTVGKMEAFLCIANCVNICPIQWISNTTPIFKISNTFDINIPISAHRTPFSLDFSEKRHSLLTGPNRGGKSTVLRAVVLSSLLAHTYGGAICTSCTMTPFRSMHVCIRTEDLPGTISRFEHEVQFTADTIISGNKYKMPILVFIDELYHSTNPPDAFEACRIYCNQLWNMSNTISIISTHIFDLVEQSNQSNIQRLCCDASINSFGHIQFKYNLRPGICKVSSVNEILKKYGILH